MHQSTVVILFDIQRAHLSSMGTPSRGLQSPLNVIPLVFSGRLRYPRLLAWIWNQLFLQGIPVPFYACKGHNLGTRGRFVLKMVIFVLEWEPHLPRYLIIPAPCGHLAPPGYSLPPTHLEQPMLTSPPPRPDLLSQSVHPSRLSRMLHSSSSVLRCQREEHLPTAKE